MITRIFCIFLCFGSIIFGQGTPNTAGPMWISVYAEGEPAAFKGLSYLSSGVAKPVPLTLGKRGGKFRYSGPQDLIFFIELPSVNGAPSQRVERARVMLPASSSEVVLMMGVKDGRIGVTAIDTTITRFPSGSLMVLNYTQAPIAFKVGSTEGLTRPQVPSLFGPFTAESADISYLAAMQIDGQWKIITQNSYPVRPNMRYLLVLRPTTEPLKPRFIWINDPVTTSAAPTPPVRR